MIVTSSTNLFKSKKLLLDRYFPKEINTNRFLNTLNDELDALVQKNRIIFKKNKRRIYKLLLTSSMIDFPRL